MTLHSTPPLVAAPRTQLQEFHQPLKGRRGSSPARPPALAPWIPRPAYHVTSLRLSFRVYKMGIMQRLAQSALHKCELSPPSSATGCAHRADDDETARGLPSPAVSNSASVLPAAYSPPAGKLGNRCSEKQCKGQGQNQIFKGRDRCNPGEPPREVVFNPGGKNKKMFFRLPQSMDTANDANLAKAWPAARLLSNEGHRSAN